MGKLSMTAVVNERFRVVVRMSTMGLSPVTVIVSSSDPTSSSPLTFAVNPAETQSHLGAECGSQPA